MRAPRWSRFLLRRLAPPGQEDDVLGDLEETYRAQVAQRGRVLGGLASAVETLDMAFALLRQRRWNPAFSLLDFKLGIRMLVRYPGLTVLGGVAIAFAIFAGAGTFEFLSQVGFPRLPFPDGDRLVTLQLWDARAGDPQGRALYDVGVWQEELTSVEEVGAFDSVVRNLIVEGAGAHLLTGARMDAAGFRITSVEALMGRTLQEEDARPAAPSVVVLGFPVWRDILESDPDVLGRVIRVGTEPATVVGVMPEGFAFPVAHQFWLPLKVDPTVVEPGGGPRVAAFGRLAPGFSREEAQTEVTRLGTRLARVHPETHEHIRPFVKPYARGAMGLPVSTSDGFISAVILAWNLPLVLFLVLICGNVALLMFARAAARESELVVRSALGAGRRRIVGQLFAEALVLATVGAAVGLSLAGYGLRWGYHIIEVELWEGGLPFWFHPELSLRTVAYTVLLTLGAAVVAGVAPALKATRGLGAQLRQASAGAGGARFGGIWSVVIVLQVTLTVGFPAVAWAVATEGREIQRFDLGIPAHRYLTASMALEPEGVATDQPEDTAAFRARVVATWARLEERLLAHPNVLGVTFAERAPRQYNGWNQIEVDGPTAPPQDERGHRLGRVDVETDFFPVLGIEPRLGRDFHRGDAEPGSDAVIVNEAFVDYVLGGRNPLGVTFRFVASERQGYHGDNPGPWLRVVGVVQDLGAMSGYSGAIVYQPVPDGSLNPAAALIHVADDAAGFAPTLRSMAFDVDPTLRIGETLPLDRMVDSTVEFYRFWVTLLVVVSGLAVVLSLGGIYAVLSFIVARRTREIGVRVALGAPRRRVVLAVFRRPLVQVSLGLVCGAVLAGVLLGLATSGLSPAEMAGFAVYMVAMGIVCLTACIAPTRRALAVEPSEALRAE